MKYTYRAIVTDVHDGDSITVDVDLGFKVWVRDLKIRLHGINAPELNTEEGEHVARLLREMLGGREIVLHTIHDRTGKYGRWLGVVYLGDVNVNQLLLDEELVIPYP